MLACDEPQATSSSVRIEHLHAAPDLVGDAAIFVGGAVVHLPRPVHLVAEAPDLDVVRVRRAVLAAQVAPVAAAGMVAVFEHGEGFGEALGAEVDGKHRLGAGLLAPADELVGADLVGLAGLPGIVEPRPGAGPSARCRPASRSWRRNCRRDSAPPAHSGRAPVPARRRGIRPRRRSRGRARRCRHRRRGRDARGRRCRCGCRSSDLEIAVDCNARLHARRLPCL